RLGGTTRWFSKEVGDLIERRMEEVAQRVAEGFECRAEIKYVRRYPATINDADAAAFVRDSAAEAGFEVVSLKPSMGAEDFAFMLEKKPGAYIWLGSEREGQNPVLHSPRFDFND